jgi:hypothetical protein
MVIRLREGDVYGHLAILRHYSNVGLWRHSDAVLQHGWTPTIHEYMLNLSGRTRKLVWNRRDIDRFGRFGVHAESVGAPFIYLAHLFALHGSTLFDRCNSSYNRAAATTSTLVYCPHSWIGAPGSVNLVDFVRDVIEDRGGTNLTFVLHSFEYQNAAVRSEIMKMGVQAISHASDTLDPFSSHRQLQVLLRADEVLCGYLGTPLMYGAYLGKRCQLIGLKDQYYSAGSPPVLNCYGLSERVDPSDGNERGFEFFQSFKFPDHSEILNLESVFRQGVEGEAAKEIGQYELGFEFFRSSAEVRSALGWDIGSQPLNIGRRVCSGVRRRLSGFGRSTSTRESVSD